RLAPVKKLSTQRMTAPPANRRSHKCEPRKPAPPVISTRASICICPTTPLNCVNCSLQRLSLRDCTAATILPPLVSDNRDHSSKSCAARAHRFALRRFFDFLGEVLWEAIVF